MQYALDTYGLDTYALDTYGLGITQLRWTALFSRAGVGSASE